MKEDSCTFVRGKGCVLLTKKVDGKKRGKYVCDKQIIDYRRLFSGIVDFLKNRRFFISRVIPPLDTGGVQ